MLLSSFYELWVCMECVNDRGESVEHRIDAATREAEAGFTVCRGCEFENFKRFSYCSLCGEKLPSVGDEDGTSSSRSTTTSELTAASDGSAQLTRQQTRARYVAHSIRKPCLVTRRGAHRELVFPPYDC